MPPDPCTSASSLPHPLVRGTVTTASTSRRGVTEMANLQVLRFEGRADLNQRLVDHIMGRSRPKTAIDRSAQGIVNLTIREDYDLADATIKLGELAARGKRGRRAQHVLVEAIMAGAPPYEQRVDDDGNVIPGQPKPWSQWKVQRWALRSIARIRRLVEANGKAKLCFAALHQDETSPHIHLAFVPLCSDGRLSWTHLKKELAGVSTARDDHSKRTAAMAMTALQDDYHMWVGRRYGLARGEPQSKTRRVHTAIDRVEAAKRQAEIIRARAAAQARKKVAEAKAEADKLQHQAQRRVDDTRTAEQESADRRTRIEGELELLAEQKRSTELRIETLHRNEASLCKHADEAAQRHSDAAAGLVNLREQREAEERKRDEAQAAQHEAERAAAAAESREQRARVIIDAVAQRETELGERADASLRTALDAEQRRSTAADALVGIQEKRAREEAERDEARAARIREEQAAQAAQVARERDEEIGERWVAGRHARRGRELRKVLEAERDTAIEERDSARGLLKTSQQRAQQVQGKVERLTQANSVFATQVQTLTSECDEAREDVRKANLARGETLKAHNKGLRAQYEAGYDQGKRDAAMSFASHLKRVLTALGIIDLPGARWFRRMIEKGGSGLIDDAIPAKAEAAAQARAARERESERPEQPASAPSPQHGGGWER